MSNNTIALTILEQLGGNAFAVMTGARNFVRYDDRNLTFRLPSNFARNGINCVSITLTPADVYDVKFMKIRGTTVKTISEHAGIYCDMLREVFRDQTGLENRAPIIRRA